jgi:hypothetical protein
MLLDRQSCFISALHCCEHALKPAMCAVNHGFSDDNQTCTGTRSRDLFSVAAEMGDA